MHNTIYYLLFYLFIYSLLGWICEVLYAYILNGKYVNRGFLYGPFCPIYGVGFVIILMFMDLMYTQFHFEISVLILFIIVTISTTVLEFITGWILEKIFNTRWWDYSNEKYNFMGLICLKFSLIWGICGVLIIKTVHPFITYLIKAIPVSAGSFILICFYIYFTVDIIYTVRQLFAFKDIIIQMNAVSKQITHNIFEIINEMESKREFINEELNHKVKNKLKEIKSYRDQLHYNMYHRLDEYLTLHYKNEKLDEIKIKTKTAFEEQWLRFDSLKEKACKFRLTKAFPHMTSKKYKEIIKQIKKK